MRRSELICWLCCIIAVTSAVVCAQTRSPESSTAELRLRLVPSQPNKHSVVSAVLWLEPMAGTHVPSFSQRGHYFLMQKDRTFIPHLQVVPTGSVVQFPNDDPFFHNVFSLFDGKRFDLGLYEAGSSRSVTFSREGVSYIFCNIHPEMSAVVVTLSTPLYALADAKGSFMLRNIQRGDYKLHLWIEGVPPSFLNTLDRQVHLSSGITDLGELKVPLPSAQTVTHTNKFGKAYVPDNQSTY